MKYLFLSLILLIFSACTTRKSVDLIVYNAAVYTVDSAFTKAQSFAIKDGKFVAIGSSQNILDQYDAPEIIDAAGQPIYPGFYDAHAHYFLLADLLDQVDLKGTRSYEQVIAKLKLYQQQHPGKAWIIGNGWDQNLWPDQKFPTKELLDQAFPETPVMLFRVDYHAVVVNSKALEIAQITDTRKVEGGIIAGENNIPNGLLIDNAFNIVLPFLPEPNEQDRLKLLQVAQDSLFEVGLTSIVDAGLTESQLDLLKKYYTQNQLKIRNYAMVSGNPKSIDNYLKSGIFESDRLTIRSFKLMADGALGSRGACLLDHYQDAPTRGFLLLSEAELDQVIQQLAQSNFQVNTHAIGDSANRILLDIYGKYLNQQADRRWRIEHAQIIAPSDFYKFKKFQIIPSVQPTHATSDMYWAEERLGKERLKSSYAYKDLLQAYGKIALGSDFPVEHFNPLFGFHAAVARQDAQNYPAHGFQIENALSREEALKGMTIWAAFASFEEHKRGSIEKGKDADFVILDQDIMRIPTDKLRQVKVVRTVVAGESVFQK